METSLLENDTMGSEVWQVKKAALLLDGADVLLIVMTQASCITILAFAVFPGFAGAAETNAKASWPQFRGPNSSGIGEGEPPVQFGPDQKALWKVAVGQGISSPIVWDRRIFLTEFDPAKKQFSTVCIDQRTGKV